MVSQISFDTIIIGSGLSGLSAAIKLIQHNHKVLILESRPVLGGRTSSWTQNDMEVESGLHRYLGFYQALPQLLQSVNTDIDDIIHWTDKIEIRLPNPQPNAIFSLSPLHKPLDTLTQTISNNDFISPSQKLNLTNFFTRGFIDFNNNPLQLDHTTVLDYAHQLDLDQTTITRILIPLTEGLFFLPIEKYSALNFFAQFAPYLTKLHLTRVGSFKGGMSTVLIQPLADYIQTHHGQIKTNSPVTSIQPTKNSHFNLTTPTTTYSAPHVILATSLAPAQQLTQPFTSTHSYFKKLSTLPTMPTVTLQIELNQPASPHDHTIFGPTTPLASFAEESRTTFTQSTGRLSIILSHPQKHLHQPKQKILQQVIAAAQNLNLNLTQSSVKNAQIVSWPHDFYSYQQNTYHLRPNQQTPIPGLYLAGDYTKQPYLQTMEGAVVSGQQAAQSLLDQSPHQ